MCYVLIYLKHTSHEILDILNILALCGRLTPLNIALHFKGTHQIDPNHITGYGITVHHTN